MKKRIVLLLVVTIVASAILFAAEMQRKRLFPAHLSPCQS